MRGAGVIVLAVTGCGRIAFDPLRDASGGAPDGLADGAAPVRCDATAPFTSTRPLSELSSSGLDGALRLSDDELVAYFHTDRSGTNEIWTAGRTRTDLPFDPPTPLFSILSYWPSVSSDGKSLVYAAPNDLYLSTRNTVADVFVPGNPITVVNTAAIETSPAFSHDGTRLYYTSRAGTQPLMVTAWPAIAAGQPITELDGPADEQSATLSDDERVIYFGRGPSPGDIWVAYRTDRGLPFDPPSKVAELDMGSDESPTWLSLDQCRLYFESTRLGTYDLFVAERQP